MAWISLTPDGGTVITPVPPVANDNTTTYWADVRNYGASGDGVTDDSSAIASAISSGKKVVYFPYGTYMANNLGTIPDNVTLLGDGREISIVKKNANGDLATLGEGCATDGICFDGNGATYTGRGFVISGSNGRQSFINSKIIDFHGYCVEFTTNTAGSQCTFFNTKIYRYNGLAVGFHAIKIEDTLQSSAYPRKFIAVETDGRKFIDLGGCNNVMISACRVGSIAFSTNSRGVNISGSRLAGNETTMNFSGANNAITGCDIGPQLIVTNGTAECAAYGNTFNTSPGIVDNSGMGGRNRLDFMDVTYTPTWTSAIGSPTVGNGTLSGYWSRAGAQVQCTVELVIGSSTTFGTGAWRFTLPVSPVQTGTGIARQIGSTFALQSASGNSISGVSVVYPGQTYIESYGSTTSTPQVGSAYPWVWATGDILTLSITYTI